jgi:hypothetical protein
MSFKIRSQQEINQERINKQFSSGLELEKGGKPHPVGTINKYGEMKMADGSWKYVGKQGKNHPAAQAQDKETEKLQPVNNSFKDYSDSELSSLINNLSGDSKEVQRDDKKLKAAKEEFHRRVEKKKGVVSTDDKYKVSDKEGYDKKTLKEKIEFHSNKVNENASKPGAKIAYDYHMTKLNALKQEERESNSSVKEGDVVTLNSDVNLVSFMNIKGKDLTVKSVKEVEMASGKRKFITVSDGDKDYEMNIDYVTKSTKQVEKKPKETYGFEDMKRDQNSNRKSAQQRYDDISKQITLTYKENSDKRTALSDRFHKRKEDLNNKMREALKIGNEQEYNKHSAESAKLHNDFSEQYNQISDNEKKQIEALLEEQKRAFNAGMKEERESKVKAAKKELGVESKKSDFKKYKYDYSKMSEKDLKEKYDFHRAEWKRLGEGREDGSEAKHHLTMLRVMSDKMLALRSKK